MFTGGPMGAEYTGFREDQDPPHVGLHLRREMCGSPDMHLALWELCRSASSYSYTLSDDLQ